MAAKKKEEAMLVFSKGDKLKDGNVQRLRMVKILCRFVCRYDKEAELFEDDVTMLLVLPKDHVGDTGAVMSACISKIYLDSVFTERQVDEKVEKLSELFDASGLSADKVGYEVILRYMDRLLMKGISSSIFYR